MKTFDKLSNNIYKPSIYFQTYTDFLIDPFFVSTEGNNTYKFILDIKDIPANQLFIHEKVTKEEIHYTAQEVSKELTERIRKIINIALKPKAHIGFSFKKVSKSLEHVNDISLLKVAEITGKRLRAEKIIITNESEATYEIALKDFMGDEVLAVYSPSTVFEPGANSILIRIYEDIQ